MNKKSFLILTMVLLMLISLPVFAKGSTQEVEHFGWFSLLPSIVAIVLAFLTKQVLLSLFLGVFIGATIGNGWNPFYGFLRTLDEYIVGALADSGNAAIIIFPIAIGGMIGVINKMGGTIAIAEALSKKVKTAVGAQLATWILAVFMFFDDYANILIAGSTMRPISDKMKVSKEKFSFILDASSAPVVGIALISTWVGYEIGLIKNVFEGIGVQGNYYSVFLNMIPYSFYNLFTLFLCLMVIFQSRDFGPMHEAEIRARTTGKLLDDKAKPMASGELENMEIRKDIELKVSNAVVPIAVLILVAFIGLWYNGYLNLDIDVNPLSLAGLRHCFGAADSSVALLWASITASIVAIFMGVSQKILSLNEAFDAWVEGGKSMLMACMILILAWSLGDVIKSVGTAKFLVGIVPEKLPFAVLPVIVFIISGLISFATGTAYGTMAIMIPLAVPLANSFVVKGGNPEMLIVTLSTVLSGAIFGDHCSPISDTTIMASTLSGGDHLDHVKTQMPYAITSAIVGSICYLIVGFTGIGALAGLLIGFVIIYGVVRFIGKPVPRKYIGEIKEKV